MFVLKLAGIQIILIVKWTNYLIQNEIFVKKGVWCIIIERLSDYFQYNITIIISLYYNSIL